jgi:hypothetical protein
VFLDGVLPTVRIDMPLGLIPPLQEVQEDLAQVTFESALEIIPNIPDFLNQMVDIEDLKLPGAQRGAGVQTLEVKVKVIQLCVGSHTRPPGNPAVSGGEAWDEFGNAGQQRCQALYNPAFLYKPLS